jgi:DNA-binding transcriptional ArsR family regulator
MAEVRSQTRERKRLNRLRRATEEGRELGIARSRDDRSAGHGDGMNAVPCFDGIAADRLDEDRIHEGRAYCACEWSGTAVCSAIIDRYPDYELDDILVVSERSQLRALSDDVRTAIVGLLRQRACSIQQLAHELDIPKGTVGHHVKVLEKAGLIHVVGTRKVRAITEKFYGRTARLFLFETEDPADARALGGSMLRRAAVELELSPDTGFFGHPKARLTREDARRLQRRARRLTDDFVAAENPEGEPYALAVALYEQRDA